MGFRRGDQVVWRSKPGGAVGYVMPLTVIEDGDVIALFQSPGSVCKARTGVRGGPRGRNMIQADGGHEDRPWAGPAMVRVTIPGTGFAVLRSWTGSAFHGWYVNIEADLLRTPIGFDTVDQVLDVEVTSDRSSWRWKDEDELAWSISVGRMTASEGEQIRAASLHAISLLEGGALPFVDDWSGFAPDPDWPIPALPAGWNTPEGHMLP